MKMHYLQAKSFSSNHARRVITASILSLVVLLSIYFLPTTYLVVGIYLIAYQGLDEWCHLGVPMGIFPQKHSHIYSTCLQLITLGLSMLTVIQTTQVSLQCLLPVIGMISYICLLGMNQAHQALGTWVIGLLLQGCGWYEATLLCQTDLPLLIYLSLATAIADVAGYYSGKHISLFSNKPWPSISPSKTYEGTMGMCLMPILITFITMPARVPLSFGIGLLALMGDLFVSSAKRIANVKDCGKILPGHGGVLDRLDSHLMVWAIHGALRSFA